MIMIEACRLADCPKKYFDNLDQVRDRLAAMTKEAEAAEEGREDTKERAEVIQYVRSLRIEMILMCGRSRLFPILRRPWKKNSN